MGLIAAVRSERLKAKHTSFQAIHLIVPLMGALLFIAYYMLYPKADDYQKLNLVLEITAVVFPLLISAVIGLNILLEEKASYFQILLAVPNRCKLLLAKLVVLYGAGVAALTLLFFLFMLGTTIFGVAGAVQLKLLVQAVTGMAFSSLSIYILHLFLSLKFGFGISLLWGIFESLQCILYSNIELRGIGRYIPFAWSIDWIHDVLNGTLLTHAAEWILIAVLTFCILLFVIMWFSHWEGRKNYE